MESPVPAWGVRAIRPGGITRPFWRHLPILYRGPSPKAKTAVPVRHQNSRNWRVSEPSPGDTPQRFIVTTIYFVNVMQYIRVNGIDFYIWCHNQWYWKRNCGRYRIKYAQWLTQFICDTTHSDTPQGFIITTRYVSNTFSICNAVSIWHADYCSPLSRLSRDMGSFKCVTQRSHFGERRHAHVRQCPCLSVWLVPQDE